MDENWHQSNAKIRNYFKLYFQEGHNQLPRSNINPEMVMVLFIHGVVRMHFFQKTMNTLAKKIVTVRSVISQWPLLERMIYVDELLFYKEQMTSFLSPMNDMESANKYLDNNLLEDFKKRQSNKTTDSKKQYSKYNYILSILTSHLFSREIPIYFNWAQILLFIIYTTRHFFNTFGRTMRREVLNNKFNLLKIPAENFKNLTPKSPLPRA